MDIEYLQMLWQTDDENRSYQLNEQALQRLVREESHRFERHVRWRDWYELLGSVLVGSFFLWGGLFGLPGEVAALHWDRLLLGGGCFFIAFVFVRLRRAAQAFEAAEGDSLLATLEKRKASLEHQIGNVRGLLLWYILPVAVPLGVVVAFSMSPESRVRFVVVCLLAIVAIVAMHRWYAKRRLQPKLDSVVQLIKEVA